jgi:hypothetical protein
MITRRHISLYAVGAAVGAIVLSPLLALSYFATDSGADELDAGSVAAWADPARDLAGGLLTWASPDRVYATYVQLFALLFPAVLLSARAVRAARPAQLRRGERWGWALALTGYWLAAIGLWCAFVVLVGDNGDALNIVFLALLVPGMFFSTVGSSVLGVALVRGGYLPRTTAWLLALAFPLLLVGSDVLGHNSLGLLPLFLAWAATGVAELRSRAARPRGRARARAGA